MSAPTTNVEKQKSRHSGVLRGMALVCGFAAVLFGIYYIVATSDDPADDGGEWSPAGKTILTLRKRPELATEIADTVTAVLDVHRPV